MDGKENAMNPLKEKPALQEHVLSKYPDLPQHWEEQRTPAEKMQFLLSHMHEALEQRDTPFFQKFWDLRGLALKTLKERLSPEVRSELWERFVFLSQEARKLQTFFEEQAKFDVEQIALAIEEMEKELENYASLLQEEEICLPWVEEWTGERSFYEEKQKELALLNRFFVRIGALRAELLRTAMRMKHKNTLLKRLSLVAQKVLPSRQSLMESLSARFHEDLGAFTTEYFVEDTKKPFYVLKEKIKELQALAKNLTLTSDTFMQTRTILGAFWDEIKRKQKVHKERAAKRKFESHQKKMEILEVVARLKEGSSLSSEERSKKRRDINQMLRTKELFKEDRQEIESALGYTEYKAPSAKQDAREGQKTTLFDQKILSLSESKQAMPFEDAYDRFEQLQRQVEKAPASYGENRRLRTLLLPLQEWIDATLRDKVQNIQKKTGSLESCESLLHLAQKMRRKSKQTLEDERRKKGRSGFDFQMAMHYQEQVDSEKRRLQSIDAVIETLEEQIAQTDHD
ncbi:MAG: hypothetical protein AAGF04_03950 [Chlamydiota bacterium]